ncbi:MAG: cob(I)yrinic acid a,c-diamide adenosyltransferase [Proteobacteria bacterium]|nr:MAG: cob(I)yrinic acid a,c-diamide adenosyltransferase [Pseudomonadota bacterium]
MRLSKIYTKTGDQGGTMLATGEKISKTALRIEAYGTVDELNSCVGLLRDHMQADPGLLKSWIFTSIARIQNELFDLGGELATPSSALNLAKQKVVDQGDIKQLEQEIDSCNESLPPLANFVLPGGHLCNSSAHLARTVCRRAEREVVRLRAEEKDVRVETQIYLNRLSDWLFVISRALSKELNVPEILWDQRKPKS